MQADWPERVLKPAGLGILNQRKPGCLAALRTRKFLGRYDSTIDDPAEPADDNQDIAHNNLHVPGRRRPRFRRDPSWFPVSCRGQHSQGAAMSAIDLVSGIAGQRG